MVDMNLSFLYIICIMITTMYRSLGMNIFSFRNCSYEFKFFIYYLHYDDPNVLNRSLMSEVVILGNQFF